MEQFSVGDLVVLNSGSMRMAVESVDSDKVAVVWCHEGTIGRDSFAHALLKKWEHRDGDRENRNAGGGRPYRGDQEGGGRNLRQRGSEDRNDRPRERTGWDGKPRQKKYFRKDD